MQTVSQDVTTQSPAYPSDREILAAMCSELMAECIRVTGDPDENRPWRVTCHYWSELDQVEVFGVHNHVTAWESQFFLFDADAGDKLRGLIERVSLLAVEG